ncbi:MAG: LON peptidase substrate-binding domain-containing protein [Actinomycetales bacterium]
MSASDTVELPMFPLGSVLFPGMPLPLQVFEPRYLALVSDLLAGEAQEFGVVLIERGSEVGGGDVRFEVGTVATIVSVQVADGFIALLARGGRRFQVVRWLADDPYPRAEVLLFEQWSLDDQTLRALPAAEVLVRGVLARASEFVELPWPPDIELSADPGERLWQLAAIAPLGPLDQLALLRSVDPAQLLARLTEETEATARFSEWGGPPEADSADT